MPEAPETAELSTFVTTVEARSISKAARILGLPRPTVSRRLARLEEKLGARLLHRTTRTMVLTDAGEVFYARSRVALAAVRDAVVSVQKSDDAVRGLLRIAVPPQGGKLFGQLVSDFLLAHPEVRVEMEASTRHVDLLKDGFDVAIRASTELPPGVVARTLIKGRVLAAASPAYLARAGVPSKPSELAKHACLTGFSRGEHPAREWPLLRGSVVRIESVLATNDMEALFAAALAGRGIALLPSMLIEDALADGSLVSVLPDRIGAETRLSVVYLEREFIAPAVRAFVDAAVAWARSEPRLSPQRQKSPSQAAKRHEANA